MFRNRLGALALALTLPFAACDDGTGASADGTMSLLLTDAPGDFLQAVVEIERIELIGSGGEDGGAVVLFEPDNPFVTDLLALSNDVATLVEDGVVPEGTYAQLRFVIPNACIEVEGENQTSTIYASSGFQECGAADGPLQMPSFEASGLKVNLPGGASRVEGDSKVILLDFNVAESFGQVAGNSGQWVLNPVIRADEVSFSGSLSVELVAAQDAGFDAVNGSLADFQARLEGETVPVAFTDDDQDGTWTATFDFLIPDTYQVTVELVDGVEYTFATDPESPQSVELGSGSDAVASFTVTSVEPAPAN